MILASPSGPKLIASRPSVGWEVASRERIVGGEPTGETFEDDVVMSSTTTAADIFSEATLTPDLVVPVTYASLDPDVATVDATGAVTWVSDGDARIVAKLGGAKKRFTIQVSKEAVPAGFPVFSHWVEGSAARHCTDNVDSRLAGQSATEALRIFTTQNHGAATYVRNPDCWAADFPNALTCLSPWNSNGGHRKAGTAISPRHIVFASHYQYPNGTTVRFVGMDGTVYDRTMTAKSSIAGSDLTIGLLDSDLPEAIAFAKVLPDNWADYLPEISSVRRLPCLALDQEEKATVQDWVFEGASSQLFPPTDPKRLEFYETKISGDSGNPAGPIINGDLVLLTVWTSSLSGSSIRHHRAAINAAMTSLGGGYQLSEVDLSGFNNYDAD